MTQRTALYEMESAHGARFEVRPVPGVEGEEKSWEIAAVFSSVEAECSAVRNQAGLFDFGHRGKIEISGPDRVRFLNGQVTNDVKKLASGQGCYACALDYKGALVGDMKIYAHADFLRIDASENCAAKLFDHFVRFAISDEVEIEDKTGSIAHLALHGPHSAAILNRLDSTDLVSLTDFHFLNLTIAGAIVEATAQSCLGERGFDLFLPSADAPKVWIALLEAGKDFNLKPVGAQAADILRLEAGVPLFGVDMTEDHLALEANLLSAISTDKGCYTGQEVVARIINRSHVNRILSGFQVNDSQAPAHGTELCTPEKPAGKITSAAFSPTLQKVIALGYIPSLLSRPGTIFLVGEPKSPVTAEVVDFPFYRRVEPAIAGGAKS